MPCRKKRSEKEFSKPTPYVVCLYNFDPCTYESTEIKEPNFATPDVSSQLAFKRGDKLIVLSQELDWWLFCRSIRLQEDGYVPSNLLAPLCVDDRDESSDGQGNSSECRKKLIPCGQNCVDLKYFPNAPHIAGIHQLRKPCPEISANIFSRITFWWMTGMIVTGYKRPLQDDDLWALPEVNQVDNLCKKLLKEWTKELNKASSRNEQDTKGEQAKTDSEDSGIEEKEILLVEGTAVVGETNGTQNPEKQKPEVEIKDGTRERKRHKPSLAKALIRAFGFTFFIGAVFKLFFDLLVFASPYILRLIISYVEGKGPQETWRGYVYAVSLFVVAIMQSLVLHQYFHRAFVTGMRARSGALGLIYRKMLLINNKARKQFTVGEMVNLMSVDATKLQDITTYLNMIWSAPVQIIIALIFLYDTMGWSIFAGVGVMLLLMPVNLFVSKKTKSLQVKQMKKKDIRSKIMNEILNGIKVLKLYAWEKSFIKRVFEVRQKELQHLKSAMYLGAGFSFTYSCAPFMVSVATFAVYVLTGNELTASKAFVGISLFNILRFPLAMLPSLITSLVQCRVSMKRISEFLQAEELDLDAVSYSKNGSEDAEVVRIDNGTFTWESHESPILSKINLSVKSRELLAVVGTVGTGKSSLLSALLGEMEKIDGNVSMKGTVAYVPQQAWIQNATLQDNILFGRKYKGKKYEKIIDACALRNDLEVLPVGDMTEIGEKGINLSGGQKQRVSIARAVYSNADIYLFDDPLSAVDAHVGRHIFDEVIGPYGILKDKVRILVTHGLSYLAEVDRVVVLQNGKISEAGSYQELIDNDDAFAEFLRTYLIDAGEDLEAFDEEGVSRKETLIAQVARKISMESIFSEGAEMEMTSREQVNYDDVTSDMSAHGGRIRTYTECSAYEDGEIDELLHKHLVQETINKKHTEGNMIKAETAETGRVKVGVFFTYAKTMGIFFAVLIVLSSICYEGFAISSRIWLARWSSSHNSTAKERNLYLGIYGCLGLGQALFVLTNAYLIAYCAFKASRDLHNSLVENVLHCPMSFFETTPMGRIINRFSSDINKIDEVIPFSIKSFLGTMASVSGTLFVISFTTPVFLAVMLPLLILYIVTQRFYVATSRQLKRLEAVKKSPIYNHFFESINGASTIRAYKEQDRFIRDSEVKVDENQTAYYPSVSANRWLAVRLEFVGNCIVFFAALFAVNQKDSLSAGLIGLSITYALSVTQTLNWLVRMTSELETNIVSVERVKEYADAPGEAEWEIKDKKPPSDWPDSGVVVFNEYSVRYRPGLDLVLKGMKCGIHRGEKVGVVGRTGAGKSSIALALFRIMESAEGNILIDGIDISTIGLHDLRSKLTIIPQDPVLFSGSLRFNLDPFSNYSDDELWYALEVAHLKSFVSTLEAKLEHEISEGGENLSVGQRQLICLGRALLRKTKILVLDEATAAVDMETDELIQGTIRNEFKDCTILTIAHRLNTIMDYDRIMVLDQGKVVELAPPSELLADKESKFYSMAKDAGLA